MQIYVNVTARLNEMVQARCPARTKACNPNGCPVIVCTAATVGYKLVRREIHYSNRKRK